jgi:TatD DNase family protein
MVLTDTHTHLYSEQFNDDRTAMVQRALDAGVTRLFMPNVDKDSIDGMMALADQFPNHCFPMMGLHPCSVNEFVGEEMEIVKQWLFGEHGKRFAAVGEIGLDYYWDRTFEEQQREAFKQQIQWAKELGLPIVIHSRESLHDGIKIVRELKDERLKGIFHCFSGTVEQAQQITELGFYLGIGGVVTFKKSGLDEVVRQIPLQHLVLETDAPYLAPTPHRGKRNESAYLTLIAQTVADIKQISIAQVAEVTTANARLVFGG